MVWRFFLFGSTYIHTNVQSILLFSSGIYLGNQKIHTITKQGNYELRVDISDFDGSKAYARYVIFSVGDASTNYKLTVNGYIGTAGES